MARDTIPVPVATLHALRETLRSHVHRRPEPDLLRALDQVHQLLVPGLAQDRLVLRPEGWLCIACGATFPETQGAKRHTCPL